MTKPTNEIAIIGAGPYGLSAASHLRSAGFKTVVFGKAMEFWKEQMPHGMRLRSSWDASHISDPQRAWTLDAYQHDQGIKVTTPIPIADFIQYGEWFQRRAASDLDSRRVREIRPAANSFCLVLEDGEELWVDRVVVAAGIGPFAYRPPQFSELPAQFVSHSADNCDFASFAGRRVIVVGCGQSAIESAALLHEAGAEVEVIARAAGIRWLKRSGWLHTRVPGFIRRMLYPPSDVGPPGLNQIVSRPDLFQRMPVDMQTWVAYRSIRPAAAGWLGTRIDGIHVSLGRQIQKVLLKDREVEVWLDNGEERRADHIFLATGYQVDIAKYRFLSGGLVDSIRQIGRYPVLSAGMESSIAGLHFLGAPAAVSYGPLMRFVSGTDYAARQLTRCLLSNQGNSNARKGNGDEK